MRKHFITYGNDRFAEAKIRISREAKATGEFDVVCAYGPDDVSEDVKSSELFSSEKGGGYWCWKPDIIVRELEKMEFGDILVYVDAGCELVPGREWKKYWRLLEGKSLIVQRIYQLNEKWTRRTIVEGFADNPEGWLKKCQFMCGVVFAKKTQDTIDFLREWRAYMIQRPDMVADVPPENLSAESNRFIENRHDQSILSALVYKHMVKGFIACLWEHAENQSMFRSQVIRAMRNRTGAPVSWSRRMREMILRVAKDLLRKPYYMVKTMTF